MKLVMEFFVMEDPLPMEPRPRAWTVYVKRPGVILDLKRFEELPGEADDDAGMQRAHDWATRAAVFFAADRPHEIEVLRRG